MRVSEPSAAALLENLTAWSGILNGISALRRLMTRDSRSYHTQQIVDYLDFRVALRE